MLDRDDVPHVFDGRAPETAWAALREWLKTINRVLFVINSDEPRAFMALNNPGIPYMLLCSCGAEDHAVVCLNEKVFHDPAWYRAAITGPTSEGHFIIGIIGVVL